MAFLVDFYCPSGQSPITVTRDCLGMTQVRAVLRQLGSSIERVPLSVFSFYTAEPLYPKGFLVVAPDNLVYSCPHFEHSNFVFVRVPRGGLNGFVITKAFVYYDWGDSEKTPKRVEFRFAVDERAILEKWCKAKWPLHWKINTRYTGETVEVIEQFTQKG